MNTPLESWYQLTGPEQSALLDAYALAAEGEEAAHQFDHIERGRE